MAAEDLDSVRRLFEAWSRGDWTPGVELFADDVQVTVFDPDGDEIELDGLAALLRDGKVVEFSTTRHADVADQRAGINAR